MPIPKKVEARLGPALRRYQQILSTARDRDINEADTVTIVKDILADVFGYDKYLEITGEHLIRGTFVDLVIKVDGKLEILVEVKAINTELKEQHVKQAVDYAANQGVDWVILTNGVIWRVFRVTFAKPIGQELVLELDLLWLNYRAAAHLEMLYVITREAITRASLADYHLQRQATSKYLIGAILVSDPVLEIVRREIRRMSPDVRVEVEDLRSTVRNEVLKREIIEGEKADEARKKVQRTAGRLLRVKTTKGVASNGPTAAAQDALVVEVAPEKSKAAGIDEGS